LYIERLDVVVFVDHSYDTKGVCRSGEININGSHCCFNKEKQVVDTIFQGARSLNSDHDVRHGEVRIRCRSADE
jgi:hypothetical protein